MKSLVDIINESHGAELLKRTADRFFGDVLGKSRDLKNTISRSKIVLKEIAGELTNDEVETLEKLINNPNRTFDKRSSMFMWVMEYEGEKYYRCEFNLFCINMLKSMQSQLTPEVMKRNIKSLPKKGILSSVYSNFHSFGNTINASVQLRESNDLQIVVDFIKYVLKTIEPIKDDILNYRDDMADERGY